MDQFLNPKLLEALEFAAIAHLGQKRIKGTPYIYHPFSVGWILQKAGFSEKVVIAGILHDVVEDTSFTAKDIEVKFGKEVVELVLGVTQDMNLPFAEQKKKYLEHLASASSEIKAISAADLLANRVDSLLTLKQGIIPWEGDRTPQQVMAIDQKRIEIIKAGTNLPFIDELEKVEQEVVGLVNKL